MKITKLGNQKNRQSVYVDDNFVCFLSSFSIFKHKLFEGKEIELDELSKIQFESDQDYAFNLAIKHLSKYEKTEKQLKDFLISKGFLPKLCDYVLEKVKEYNYISDQNYAEHFLNSTKHKYGENKIRQVLKQNGVSEEIISKLEIETDFEALNLIVDKYMKNKEKTFENYQKCGKFLLSRGFSWGDVSKVLENKRGEEDESWK